MPECVSEPHDTLPPLIYCMHCFAPPPPPPTPLPKCLDETLTSMLASKLSSFCWVYPIEQCLLVDTHMSSSTEKMVCVSNLQLDCFIFLEAHPVELPTCNCLSLSVDNSSQEMCVQVCIHIHLKCNPIPPY